MIALWLVFAMMLAASPQNATTDSQTTMQQRAHDEYERHKQAAIRINALAEQIHSEADAAALVSEIASIFDKELPSAWARNIVRQRIAHAEWESVRNPAKLISEQRIVDVWNEYIREIGAPEEALVTTAEVHNMRDADLTVAQLLWARGSQTIWTMPSVYAVGTDGKVADGCRAVEAVRVLHDLDSLFQNLLGARGRVRMGIVASEEAKKRMGDSTPRPQSTARLEAHLDSNPIRPAEQHYLQEHGSNAYNHLLSHLFDELFPSE